MNNILDDIRIANQKRAECSHIWILREDKKSIYCYDCKLEKEIQEGTKLE